MEFGKVGHIDQVDFSLKPISQLSLDTLRKNDSQPLNFYIGATAWGMKEWIGKYYPPGTKARDYLKHYDQLFNTIEFNTTHYRIPDFKTVEKWRSTVSKDFKFCPKLPQIVSHRKDLGIVTGNLDLFIESISVLQENLGPCFMQLPPYFDADRIQRIEQFCKAWPSDLELTIEFRHPSWFEGDIDQDLHEIFTRKKVAKLITDVAGRRDVQHGEYWQSFNQLRFVGNDLHATDYQRMDSWLDTIVELQRTGLRDFYFFMHQPSALKAAEAIEYILEKLDAQPDITTKKMKPGFPGQLTIF